MLSKPLSILIAVLTTSVLLPAFGCASSTTTERPATSATAQNPESAGVTLSLFAPPDVSTSEGPVVVWWETETERQHQPGMGDALNRRLLRAAVFKSQRFDNGRSIELTVPRPPVGAEDVVWHVIHDENRRYWDTAFGAPTGNLQATTSPAAVPDSDTPLSILLNQRPPPPAEAAKEPCVGEGLELVTLTVPEIIGSVGNDPVRRLCVSVPPAYDASAGKKHPVVFMLPGLHSTHMSKLMGSSDLRPVRNTVFPDAILVGVDGRTRLGSTYFMSSSVSGDWNVFLDKMVAKIDARYATIGTAKSRSLIGQSTGGFNAIALTMRRPDLFGGAAASAPDGLDMTRWLEGQSADKKMAARWHGWMRLEHQLTGPIAKDVPVQWGQLISYAADFSPAPGATPPWRWPADLVTGTLVPEVAALWQAASPAGMLDDADRLASLRETHSSRLFIAVGRNDEFDLFAPAEAFSAKANALDFPHTFVATDEGHFQSTDRLRKGLAFLGQLPLQ